MTSRGDAQGAVILGSGAPPATLIAAIGTLYIDLSNSNNAYVMQANGSWGGTGGTGGASTGTGNIVRATSPTITTPVITRPQFPGQTVASLPAAAAGNLGMRSTVTDSNATTTAGIGAVVAGGGANVNPVYSDGAAWRIG